MVGPATTCRIRRTSGGALAAGGVLNAPGLALPVDQVGRDEVATSWADRRQTIVTFEFAEVIVLI